MKIMFTVEHFVTRYIIPLFAKFNLQVKAQIMIQQKFLINYIKNFKTVKYRSQSENLVNIELFREQFEGARNISKLFF